MTRLSEFAGTCKYASETAFLHFPLERRQADVLAFIDSRSAPGAPD
jgi:hypothetical protein